MLLTSFGAKEAKESLKTKARLKKLDSPSRLAECWQSAKGSQVLLNTASDDKMQRQTVTPLLMSEQMAGLDTLSQELEEICAGNNSCCKE